MVSNLVKCGMKLLFHGSITNYLLQWRHNGHDGVPDHQPDVFLLNRYSGADQIKTSKLSVTGLCAGNSPVVGEFPHKLPVTRKMFPLDDVIMCWVYGIYLPILFSVA